MTACSGCHHLHPRRHRSNSYRVTQTTELFVLLQQAKQLAKRYRELTGRPMGITGEVAESEAVRLLGVELADVRMAGYDVIRETPSGIQRLQVKGRVVPSRRSLGQRIGAIDVTKEWDAVLLVLMDRDFDTFAIYEAERAAVIEALTRPGSKARNERGALSVSVFRRIGLQVWPPAEGALG
jgi:hypothetical protein